MKYSAAPLSWLLVLLLFYAFRLRICVSRSIVGAGPKVDIETEAVLKGAWFVGTFSGRRCGDDKTMQFDTKSRVRNGRTLICLEERK